MMMDDGLDELFGDAPPLNIPPPTPKGLLQHVDDLRLSGCCQYVFKKLRASGKKTAEMMFRKIAWSKLGCIAYTTHDGHGVSIRNLLCSPDDGQWKLSEERMEGEVSAVHSDHQIVHLSWNPAGNDLAIIDVFGQISIFSVLVALNRLNLSRECVIDPEENLSSVVGLKWLNPERPVQLTQKIGC